MTQFAASTYATPEDMPAMEQAREWINTAGTDVWRSLTDPYAAESDVYKRQLQASLMQNAVEHEPRPCVFFLEDNGYDLMVFSWHRNQQGLFDAMSFKHLQYDDLSMQVTTISHSEDMSESFPAKTMSDGELLTHCLLYTSGGAK